MNQLELNLTPSKNIQPYYTTAAKKFLLDSMFVSLTKLARI